MPQVETKVLISPATTPGSPSDGEIYFIPCTEDFSKQPAPIVTWYSHYPPPVAILTISAIELIVFLICTKEQYLLLRYDPYQQQEAWRFVSYMLLHDDLCHIILNIVIQCIFAVTLEKNQGFLRVLVLYFGGGIMGALGAGCVRPDLVVGASAGVYALLISHLSHIILNLETTKYKKMGSLAVSIIVVSDVVYNVIHVRSKNDPIISVGAHVAGAATGFLLGLLIYRSNDKKSNLRRRIAFCFALVFLVILTTVLLILNFQVKRCTPVEIQRVRYIYLC